MINSKTPLVALRDTVVFPKFVIPLFIGRPKSIVAIEEAFSNDKLVVFVTQKDSAVDNVSPSDLYKFGTVCRIEQMIKLTDGTIKILVEGLYRAIIDEIIDDAEMMIAKVTEVASEQKVATQELEGLSLAVLSNFKAFFKHDKKLSPDVFDSISSIDDLSKLADTVASYLPLKISERQKILEILSVSDRLEKLI